MRNKTIATLMIAHPILGCIPSNERFEVNKENNTVKTDSVNKVIPDEIRPDLHIYGINTDTAESYTELLKIVKEKRRQLKTLYEQKVITVDSVSTLFCDLLVNQVIPHWYGTTWSFEGHTDMPLNGEIACGYFISTTLKHAGLNLNRFLMAQQPALNAMKSIINSKSIIVLGNSSPDKMITYIKDKQKEGLYLVGLDCHVGFLLYRKREVFFIHSSYMNPYCVVIEYANKSKVLAASRSFYIAPVSNNSSLMNKWLEGSVIEIVTR